MNAGPPPPNSGAAMPHPNALALLSASLALGALACTGCSSTAHARKRPLTLGETAAHAPAPTAALRTAVGLDMQGQVVTTNDFRGKVVVLDFWATWCGPCKASSPAFQQLSDTFAGDPRIMTLAIHTDGTGDPKAYMREHGYTFRSIPRGHEFAEAYDVRVLPTFLILDQRGRVIYRDTGMMGQSQRMEMERIVRGAAR